MEAFELIDEAIQNLKSYVELETNTTTKRYLQTLITRFELIKRSLEREKKLAGSWWIK